jgi:hypothetical protein
VIYVMALDQIDKAPWHGKVYEVPNQRFVSLAPLSLSPRRGRGSD